MVDEGGLRSLKLKKVNKANKEKEKVIEVSSLPKRAPKTSWGI
jgi:UPF0288 family protein (methanogenesis marker protein 3)